MNERGTQAGSRRKRPLFRPSASSMSDRFCAAAAAVVATMAAHHITSSPQAAILKMGAQFLAFDLGAESGRAISGRLETGVLSLTEICRFGNEPVHEDGSLRWDLRRLWQHMQGAL